MAKPTHLKVVPNKSIWVRKEHLSGEAAPENDKDLMSVVHKGESRLIAFNQALDLIAAGIAFEDNMVNEPVIKTIREEVKATEKLAAKKAA